MKLDIKIVILLIAATVLAYTSGLYSYSAFFEKEVSINPNKISPHPHIEKEVIYRNNSLSEFQSFADIFQKSKTSLVSVEVERTENESRLEGQGSGWVYDKQGHIITNHHVIKNTDEIRVRFLDGEVLEAKVVGSDPYSDIAVLKIDTNKNLNPLEVGESQNIDVGDPVAALGNPYGLSGSMTTGIVSQKGRILSAVGGFSIADVIQIDAAVNPGNSGGPLLNRYGEVIGVNTALKSRTGSFTGIGFSVPSETVKRVADSIIEKGKYEHSWIGITGRDVTPEIADAMGLEEATGFLVLGVVDGSPADKYGIQSGSANFSTNNDQIKIGGDVIVGIDGVKVRKVNDILAYLEKNTDVGDTVTLTVIRDGKRKKIDLKLAARPDVKK